MRWAFCGCRRAAIPGPTAGKGGYAPWKSAFSAASRAYGVTQPARSNGIAKLEERLAEKLFDVAHFMVRNLTAAEPSPDPDLDALMDAANPGQFVWRPPHRRTAHRLP